MSAGPVPEDRMEPHIATVLPEPQLLMFVLNCSETRGSASFQRTKSSVQIWVKLFILRAIQWKPNSDFFIQVLIYISLSSWHVYSAFLSAHYVLTVTFRWSVAVTRDSPGQSDNLVTHAVSTSGQQQFLLGEATLRLSPGAGGGPQMSPISPPALTQHKVIVCGGAHGIEYIGFVRDLELWGRGNEIMS